MLCYHAVSEVWPAELSVHPEALERQLRFLLDRGYQPATFTELVTDGGRRKSFAVTFDDGFVSVGTLAGPILGRLGIPGTVFVVTDHVGAAAPMTWPGIEQWLKTPHEPELMPLGWDDLRDLQSAGWEIGARTCSHPHLTQVPDEHLENELTRRGAFAPSGSASVLPSPTHTVTSMRGLSRPRGRRATRRAPHSLLAGARAASWIGRASASGRATTSDGSGLRPATSREPSAGVSGADPTVSRLPCP